jgi:hypothetical protein
MRASVIRAVLRLHRAESGQVTAWTIGLLLLFLGIMAFTFDAGFWLLDRRGGQNQVDASVLAGVQQLPLPPPNLQTAADAAQDWLERNSRTTQGAVQSECRVPDTEGSVLYDEERSGFAFADADGDGEYDRIRACIRRDGLVLFGRIFDVVGIEIPAVAAARVRIQEEPALYALMAMRDEDCENMLFTGNIDVNLQGAANSYTESQDPDCVDHFRVDGTNARIESEGEHHVRGDAGGCANDLPTCVYDPGEPGVANIEEDFATNIDDPWGCPPDSTTGSCVEPPSFSDLDCSDPSNSRTFTSSGSLDPGVYCRVTISGGGTVVTLTGSGPDPDANEAVYVFLRGLGLDGGGSTRLTSNGIPVLMYMSCDPPACGADPDLCCDGVEPLIGFEVRGNYDGGPTDPPKLDLTGHPAYEEIAIWVDRSASDDESCREVGGGGSIGSDGFASVSVTGQGDVVIDGHVYAIGTTVDFGGQGDAEYELGGAIVADRICFRGQAEYSVEWVEVPIQDPGEPLFELVE